MIKQFDFLKLFEQFIAESKSGKRLKKDGSRIRPGTIENYESVLKELKRFSTKHNFKMRINNCKQISTRGLKSEKIYWKRFYKAYSDYLYSLGCYDNYVGLHFKIIRTFFNYLRREKSIVTGDFHKNFYIRNETIPIYVLHPHQLQFLISDTHFEESLPLYLKKTKDIFVFGCTVGLRFSDLMTLKKQNLEKINGLAYLRTRSIKTFTDTRIKLPVYAQEIINRYKHLKTLLPVVSNNRLNLNLKELCDLAGWNYEVGKQHEKRGVMKSIKLKGQSYRFCDLVSTHTMRRTSITTLLSLGMPEIMVRKISGHSANSKEFYRYVNYAQQFIDKETDKIFSTLKIDEKQQNFADFANFNDIYNDAEPLFHQQ